MRLVYLVPMIDRDGSSIDPLFFHQFSLTTSSVSSF
jgi:hypothetical protein